MGRQDGFHKTARQLLGTTLSCSCPACTRHGMPCPNCNPALVHITAVHFDYPPIALREHGWVPQTRETGFFPLSNLFGPLLLLLTANRTVHENGRFAVDAVFQVIERIDLPEIAGGRQHDASSSRINYCA